MASFVAPYNPDNILPQSTVRSPTVTPLSGQNSPDGVLVFTLFLCCIQYDIFRVKKTHRSATTNSGARIQNSPSPDFYIRRSSCAFHVHTSTTPRRSLNDRAVRIHTGSETHGMTTGIRSLWIRIFKLLIFRILLFLLPFLCDGIASLEQGWFAAF